MIDDIRELLNKYADWVRDKSVLRHLNDDYVEITTPYLDRHNDYLQLYVRRYNSGYLLTDGGEVIGDLRSSGCDLETKRRQQLLRATLNGFGVQLEGEALQVHAIPSNFSLRKHNLVQAMLAVNDMFVLAAPTVASVFVEDVADWMTLHDVRFIPRVKFTGKSGYDHHFDFVIPSSRVKPERLVRAIARPNRETAEAVAFGWIDTREVRSVNSKCLAILNDEHAPPTGTVFDALKSYEITPVLWSEREEHLQELAA